HHASTQELLFRATRQGEWILDSREIALPFGGTIAFAHPRFAHRATTRAIGSKRTPPDSPPPRRRAATRAVSSALRAMPGPPVSPDQPRESPPPRYHEQKISRQETTRANEMNTEETVAVYSLTPVT